MALMPFGRLGWAAAFLFVACGALRLARFNVQTGVPGSKAFKGMPIPGAATILSSVVIFFYVHWDGLPEKHVFFPCTHHHPCPAHGKHPAVPWPEGGGFQGEEALLGAHCVCSGPFVLLIHPSTAIFLFAMAYLVWGIIENSMLIIKKRRQKREEQQGGTEVQP